MRMREEEAGHLREEMSARLRGIARARGKSGCASRATRVQHLRAACETRLQELLGEAQLDPARLAQEAAIAAERSDVTEELARLRSHVQQFESLLVGRGGRRQETRFSAAGNAARIQYACFRNLRGTTATAWKSRGSGLEIKSEIEKLREQVQNIE